MSHWGQFSAEALARLRALLDAAHYSSLASRPWFASKRRRPAHDLYVERRMRQGHPLPLASHSHPSRFCRSDPPALREMRELLWMQGAVDLQPRWQALVEAGLLQAEGGCLRSLVHVSALLPATYLLSSVPGRSPGEFVYLGDDTGLLLDEAMLLGARGECLLDMCCGGGALGLGLGGHFAQVVGADLNPQAIALARSNALLNGRGFRYVQSDLWSEIEGTFDWVVGNPPALPLVSRDTLFAYGGEVSTQLTCRLVDGLPSHLKVNGQALFLTFSPGDRLWQELCLPPGFSLDYRVRARFLPGLADLKVLDHVFVWIRHDGKGTRRYRGPGWNERLRGWSWPWLRGEAGPSRLP